MSPCMNISLDSLIIYVVVQHLLSCLPLIERLYATLVSYHNQIITCYFDTIWFVWHIFHISAFIWLGGVKGHLWKNVILRYFWIILKKLTVLLFWYRCKLITKKTYLIYNSISVSLLSLQIYKDILVYLKLLFKWLVRIVVLNKQAV